MAERITTASPAWQRAAMLALIEAQTMANSIGHIAEHLAEADADTETKALTEAVLACVLRLDKAVDGLTDAEAPAEEEAHPAREEGAEEAFSTASEVSRGEKATPPRIATAGPNVTDLKLTAWKLQSALAGAGQLTNAGGAENSQHAAVLIEMATDHAAELVLALEGAEEQGALNHG